MTLRRIPELLAPAGSPEALRAAVAAGADAVYLSGKRFGARKFAANFDDAALKDAIDFAHLRGVKVYVTVNTLVREEELADVACYLIRLYEMGADAILVQDLGTASLARRLVPELELHASTQATIHNREGIAWAARNGFKRVVLAREVTLEEIKKMKRKQETETEDLQVGLEAFVHGALCYSYSGQCLLSSAIGGRSGNRGMCAQPCRKPYILQKGEKDDYGRPRGLEAVPLKEKFLISTRDLSVYRQLDKIARSPLDSLKIEGRMKSAEYVAIVVGIYRKALDAIARGSWTPSAEDERDLALVFNRDFTDGYLLEAKDVMGRQMSDNRGVLIGSVTASDGQRGEAAVRLSGTLCPEQGDGLVFIAPGQEMGLVVQKPLMRDGLLRLRTPERVRPGAKVYLTGSSALARRAQEIISSTKAQIPIDLKITWEDGTPVIEGRLEKQKGARIIVRAEFKMEKAKSQPVTAQQIASQLRRTGGTPFVIGKVQMDYPGDLFAPLGALNQLRRDLLTKAEEMLLSARRPDQGNVTAAREKLEQMDLTATAIMPDGQKQARTPTLAVYADSLETVRGAVDSECRRIYFEPHLGRDSNRAEGMQKALEKAKAICKDAELIWKWPRITRADFLELARPMLANHPADGIMVENVGAAEAVLAAGPGVRLYGGSGLNVWNHLTVQSLSPPFQLLTLSPELSANQLAGAISASHRNAAALAHALRLELMVQGNLEVMVTEDCVPCLDKEKAKEKNKEKEKLAAPIFWGLQDFRRTFPIRLDDDMRTHIFNSAETCLLDYMPRIFEIGLDGVAVDARGRTERYAREMTEIYLEAIRLTEKGGGSLPEELRALTERIRPMALGGITTGHFVKGLKDEIS
ncbi:MAG: U32 family peptidase [Methanothrix sp.]|nr:MAG: U32 family peptidase [Methanothrix sp.]